MSQYKEFIQSYFQEYLQDLQTLVSIESVSDENSDCAPFGKGVQKCFDAFLAIAKRMGFEVEEMMDMRSVQICKLTPIQSILAF